MRLKPKCNESIYKMKFIVKVENYIDFKPDTRKGNIIKFNVLKNGFTHIPSLFEK